jgi:hypothetical protein
MVNFTQLAENQTFIRSVSDCSRIQSSTGFTARKRLTSAPNNGYLDSLINILKRKGLKTHPCGTLKELRKVIKRCVKCVQKIADY